MTAEIIKFRGLTKLDLDPNTVLEGAVDQLEHVVVMGFDKDGEPYFASSMADGGDVLWLMETLKFRLFGI